MSDVPALDRNAAADPATSPVTLHRLTRHRRREVRRAVAGNANTSPVDLDHLARVFADEVSQNPLLDWLTLEDSDWLMAFSDGSREHLLQNRRCPLGLLWWATRFGTLNDRLAVASNPDAPSEVVDAIARGGDEASSAARHHVRRSRPIPGEGSLRSDPAVVGADLAAVHQSFVSAAEAIGEHHGSHDDLADLVALDSIPAWLAPVLALSDDVELTRALAANRQTPPRVLEQLMVHADEPTSQLAMGNASLPGSRLLLWSRLCTYDPELTADELAVFDGVERAQHWIVRHPNAPPETAQRCLTSADWRLREAAAMHLPLTRAQALLLAEDSDRDVRAAVAGRAILPLDIVRVLLLDGDELVSGAARTRLRSGPTNGETAGSEAESEAERAAAPLLVARRAEALTRTEMSDAWLTATRNDPGPLVRVALAHNPSTPRATLALLAADEVDAVRAAVAHASNDATVCMQLAADPEASVRIAAARNPTTPSAAIERLAGEDHDGIRSALLGRGDSAIVGRLLGLEPDGTNGAAPAALVALLEGGDPLPEVPAQTWDHEWISQTLADASRVAASTLDRLVDAQGWRVRQSVARHPHASDVALRRLARDGDNDVRAAVAANPRTPDDLTIALADDADEKVRLALVRRATLPAESRRRLLYTTADPVALAQLTRHGDAEERRLRQALHARQPLPPTELASFATGGMRILAAANPAATAAILNTLVSDTGWQVREQVAANPACDAATLAILATDHDRDVRGAVAANPSSPATLTATLLNDTDSLVRRRARTNPSVTEIERARHRAATVARIARGPSPLAQAVALLCPDIEATELHRRRHHLSIHWLVRACLAGHPHLPNDLRDRLGDDAHEIVRAVARRAVPLPSALDDGPAPAFSPRTTGEAGYDDVKSPLAFAQRSVGEGR